MIKMGVFATEEEKKHLLKKATKTQNAWSMTVEGMKKLSLDNIYKSCHVIALKHGLPEIEGFYGMDETGEFVKTN